MNSTKSAFPERQLSQLCNSGFPFQTAVVAAIESVGPFEIEEEVAWRDQDGSHKFLDMVASVDQVRICVECKALRDTSLVFLLPKKNGRSETADVHAIHIRRVQDSTRRPIVVYGISQTRPLTRESIYCVVIGKTAKESRIIEKEIQPLVRGTEEYAKDRCGQLGPNQAFVCVPVFLTAASIFVAEYDPLSVSLKDAVYQARKEHIHAVPFVRFTKEFVAYGSTQTRLRTVFVAQAVHLKELVVDLGGMMMDSRADGWVTVYDP